jgi:hypothetical protein
MATTRRNDRSNALSPRINNPFQHIPFHAPDLTSVERSGGGGKRLFVPVDDEYRSEMLEMLETATTALLPDIKAHPSVPGVIVLKLRDISIAKSHRPVELMAAAALTSAGHGRIDEMLVAATPGSLQSLGAVIKTRDTKQMRANLSAIESIGAWGRERRSRSNKDQLRVRGRALLRPFRFSADDVTRGNLEALVALIRRLGVEPLALPQRWGAPLFALSGINKWSDEKLDQLLGFPGLRNILPEPEIRAEATSDSRSAPRRVSISIPAPDPSTPIVAVVDSGVSPASALLAPWIASRDTYVLEPDTDYVHGTAVASLLVAGHQLNDSHEWFPIAPCVIHDVAAIESTAAPYSDVVLRLRTAIARRRDIKIWNLSIGAQMVKDDEFTEFAIELDSLSDEFGVLFVVSSGNYRDEPRRGWPADTTLADRLLSPGESVRSLTVGSIAHLDADDAWVSAGSPSPYSRRGPGPVFTPKPDIVHVGGGVHAPWANGSSSVKVILPGDWAGRNFGTSFAAPLGSAMAAHTWSALAGRRNQDLDITPAMVKALMIHASQLGSPDRTPQERRYFGAGRPSNVMESLYDSDDSFTLVFEANLVPGRRWRKAPFPIPSALINDGKFRGEIVITAVYAPPLDANAGAEYVRANVELSFGTLDAAGNISGKVPAEGEAGSTGYEAAQIEHGGKWSPVKLHRKRFPQGTIGDNWALQATAVLRSGQPPLVEPLAVVIIVTLRAIEGNLDVHASGMRALAAVNWARQSLPARVPVVV